MSDINGTILYSGYDIMAGWASGVLATPVNYMYLEFTTDPDNLPALPDIDPAASAKDYYAQLVGPYDYLRIPILARPSTHTSNPQLGYEGNEALFIAMSNSSVGVNNGTAFEAGNAVYGVALVVSPTDDPADDRIFARAWLTPVLVKGADNQIAIQWVQRFMHENS